MDEVHDGGMFEEEGWENFSGIDRGIAKFEFIDFEKHMVDGDFGFGLGMWDLSLAFVFWILLKYEFLFLLLSLFLLPRTFLIQIKLQNTISSIH